MDSRVDTYKHIHTVQEALHRILVNLMQRQLNHDQSKLSSPEVEAFDEVTSKLHGLTYGSDEYKAYLSSGVLKPALAYHYAANDHHPEHYRDGIEGMNLVSLLEMVVDWKAASMRHANGDIRVSIELNQKRFGYSDELKRLMLNTLPLLEG